jgi:hypothetical protein
MKYPFSGIIVRFESAAPGKGTPGSQVEPKDELHVNLWEVAGRRFLDIGVMINTPKNIKNVQIDLPWKFDKTKVFDLGSRLVGEKIVAAIFNEVVRYDGANDNLLARVSFPQSNNGTGGFNLIRLNSNNFSTDPIVLSEGGSSTKLSVKLEQVPESESGNDLPCYIRFRIVDIPEGIYTAKFYQKDRNLLSSSLETRIVDFRINVRRGVPEDVLSARTDLFFPRWKKIHLFLTVDRAREMTFDSENFVACRSLEDEEIWNSYIALDNHSNDPQCSVSDYLGYQWTVKAKTSKEDQGVKYVPAKDLVALARFSQVTSSGWYMFRFVILALAVGAAGNGVWDIWKGLFPSSETNLNVAIQSGLGDSKKALMWLIVIIISVVFVTPIAIREAGTAAANKLKKFFVRLGKLFREE